MSEPTPGTHHHDGDGEPLDLTAFMDPEQLRQLEDDARRTVWTTPSGQADLATGTIRLPAQPTDTHPHREVAKVTVPPPALLSAAGLKHRALALKRLTVWHLKHVHVYVGRGIRYATGNAWGHLTARDSFAHTIAQAKRDKDGPLVRALKKEQRAERAARLRDPMTLLAAGGTVGYVAVLLAVAELWSLLLAGVILLPALGALTGYGHFEHQRRHPSEVPELPAVLPAQADALEATGRRTIGDGDRLDDTMLTGAYRDAKVIGSDDVLKLVTPPMLTADGKAWSVVFDLPSGMPARKALGAAEGLANAFGVAVQQVSQTKGDREGRIELRISLHVPFTGKARRGPLLDADRVSLWDAIPMGVSERGESVTTEWFEKTGLFGGEPGSGKSAVANNLILAAALDPTCRIYGADGKGGFDLTPLEDIADMLDTEGDPEALLAILQHVWNVVLAECKQTVKDHQVRKFSRALAATEPRCRFTLLYIDEWASYTAAAEPKTAKEMERLLRLIAQQGRAYGILVVAATQKPDSEAVPTGTRDIISTRWAGRCLTPEASDTILGKGRSAAGHNAQRVLKTQRGVGFYQTGEAADPVLMQGYFYDDDEVDAIVRRAHALRKEAGTLPSGAEPEVTVLDHLIKAASATGRDCVTREELRVYLAAMDERYAQGDGESHEKYAKRSVAQLDDDLAELGVTVEARKVPNGAGGRSMGYYLTDLRDAR